MCWPNLFASLIRLLIGSLSVDVMIDSCYMAGPNRWCSAAGEKGIHRITDILAEEADITMGLIGETELTAIGSQNLAM